MKNPTLLRTTNILSEKRCFDFVETSPMKNVLRKYIFHHNIANKLTENR